MVAFGLIWGAIVVYSLDSLWALRQAARARLTEKAHNLTVAPDTCTA
jgi:hypothetical protein